MSKHIISILLCVALIATLFSGCDSNTAKVDVDVKKPKAKAQLVVAANPIIVYDDDSVAAAVNDIKKAIDSDRKNATLSSLAESDWSWITNIGTKWKKRAVYGVESWKNGAGTPSKNLNSYIFSADGTISVSSYNTKNTSLAAYGENEFPQYGLLLSVGGKTQDAICYTVPKDGVISIPDGTVTAVQAVDKIETGFLAEDGTARSAVFAIMVNEKTVYYDQLCNSSVNGEACTQVTYSGLENIKVTAGDTITFSVILNARANKTDDITQPDEIIPNNNNNRNNNSKPNSGSSSDTSKTDNEAIPKNISFIDGYDARFKLIRSNEISATSLQNVVIFRTSMESTLGAEVFMYDDETHAATNDYEILIGECNRDESKAVYDDLINYRANHAADYIIRMVGKKLVIAATTDYALSNALNYFSENLCKSDSSSIPSSLNYIHRPKMNTVMLGDSNIGSYAIRTERYPSFMTVSAAKDIQNWVMENTGYTIVRTDDRTVSTNEILLYSTSRSGYKDYNFRTLASENLAENIGLKTSEYKVSFNGKKLYIKAGSVSAANFAVQSFIGDMNGKLKNGDIKITSSYIKTGTYKQKDYSLSNGYGLTWADDFTGDYDTGARFNKNNWSTVSGVNEGATYQLSRLYKKWGISSVNELMKKFTGNWITGTYSYNGVAGTVPDGKIMNGFIKTVGSESKNGTLYIENNAMKLIARRVTDPSDPLYDGSVSEVGAGLQSKMTMNFKYGVFETRLINPAKSSISTAVWLNAYSGGTSQKGDLNPEIDLCETFGHDNMYVHNLHTWEYGNEDGHIDHALVGDLGARPYIRPDTGEYLYDSYHTMGVEWTPEYISFLMDGEPVQTIEINNTRFSAFHKWVYADLSCSTSNNGYYGDNVALYAYDDADAVNNLRGDMYVDYVYLYQKNDSNYGLKTR